MAYEVHELNSAGQCSGVVFKNFLSIPKDQIPALARDYVSEVETQRTNEMCRCEWIVHPDDVDIDSHNCSNCHHPHLLHFEFEGMSGCHKEMPSKSAVEFTDECSCPKWIDPPRRRMRRGTQHPECPVHTKEGFILGFFEWVFSNER